jgi:hypothetical protein
MTNSSNATGQEATIFRVFDAPREEALEVLHRARVLRDVVRDAAVHDPGLDGLDGRQAGGEFRSTMVHETDGTEMPFAGTYREVVEPERIVQELRNMDDPSDLNVEVFTTTLVDLGDGKTEVTYHQMDHMPAEEYTRVEEGVNGFYDRLADQVARR